jgi:hypothetical protein
MEITILACLLMMLCVDQENILSAMATITKVNFNPVIPMDAGNIFILVDIIMKDNGCMERKKDREFFTPLKTPIKASGQIT